MAGDNKLEREQAMLRMIIVSVVFICIQIVRVKGDISDNSIDMAIHYGMANILMSGILFTFAWKNFLVKEVRYSLGIF